MPPLVHFHSTPGYTGCPHLAPLLQPKNLSRALQIAVQLLQGLAFDTIAFRGVSGALIAPALAIELGKELILIRKPEERCFSTHQIEGNRQSQRYVIVDDLVDTGSTVRAIVAGVKQLAPQAQCVGFIQLSCEMMGQPKGLRQLPEDLTHFSYKSL